MAVLLTFWSIGTKVLLLPYISQKEEMSIFRQIGEYLYIVKKDTSKPNTQWMKYMHGINRISILLFLFAMTVIVVRLFIKR
jgi:uncharacterized membrane protein YhfC